MTDQEFSAESGGVEEEAPPPQPAAEPVIPPEMPPATEWVERGEDSAGERRDSVQ